MKRPFALAGAITLMFISLLSAYSSANADEWVCQAYCGGFSGDGCKLSEPNTVYGRASDPQYAFEQMRCYSGFLYVGIDRNNNGCSLVLATMANSCIHIQDNN